MKRHRIASTIVLLTWMFGSTALSADSLTISDVQLSTRDWSLDASDQVTVSFRLSRAASVELQWFDVRDWLVRTVKSSKELPSGASTLSWDGRDEAGAAVPPEAYHYVLTARTRDGAMQVYDLTDSTGGEDFEIPGARIDAAGKRILYSLRNVARVNFRIGIREGGPLLRTLGDWHAMPPGEHSLAWDGKDASSTMDLLASRGLTLWAMAFTLPDNAILVRSPSASNSSRIDITWPKVVRARATSRPKRMFAHSQQAYEDRGDFEVTLRSRDAGFAGSRVPMEILVAPEIAQRLSRERFEIVYFIDGLFVGENEIGFLPATWAVDRSKLSPGEHYLTVNLRGYEGSFGFGTVKIVIPAAGADQASTERR
jgi:hypothetical protein